MSALPPELDRLGDALASAAQRTLDTRQRRAARRRMASVGLIAALAAAALTPGPLGSAQRVVRDVQIASAPAMYNTNSGVCGQPRGARFNEPRSCEMLHPAPQALR
jgi:hypothetical protein